jgi:hypothetical protein
MKDGLKKIVLINQVSGYLFVDIANAFAEEYDEVVLLAGTVASKQGELDKRVKVIGIKKYSKTNIFWRSLSWLIATLQIWFLIKTRYRKHELLFSSNPPPACLIPAVCNNTVSYIIYDVYPDGLVAGRFLTSKNFIIKKWEALNIVVYKKATRIITLTDGMANLLSKYISKPDIDIVPAWANKALVPTAAALQNEFVKKYGLQNKFLVVYSGNLGMGYDIETIVHLAQAVKQNESIAFIIAGEGWKKKIAEEMVQQLGLSNCMVLPLQSIEMFAFMMQAMHIGIVSLAKDASKIAVPSKTYNILASAKPVMCIGANDSELAMLLERFDAGKVFDSAEITAAAAFITQLANDEKGSYQQYCSNALKASLNFTNLNAKKIVTLVSNGREHN